MTTRTDRIGTTVRSAIPGAIVRVRDDSALHAGHAGAAPAGQTHFALEVISAEFAGVPRVERSRRMHALLAAEFAGGLHALNLTLRTPDEDAASRRSASTR